jgi:peptidoglycan/xylan/chitin deacetylase (PgdA/CDA1 family)
MLRARNRTRVIVGLCRADKVLLGGGTALVGSAALFDASALTLGVPAAAFAALLADGIFRPSSGTFYPTISKGPRNRPRVALTFDDGPDADVTPRALEVLGRYEARATFFMIGKHLEKSMRLGAQVVAAGHEIGNHSWQHSYLQNFYSVKALLTDIDRTEALIRSLTGSSKSSPYRAPVGLKSPGLARAAHARALEIIAWSVHSRDTIDSDPERIARRVLARIRPGDIVLMHDGHQKPGERRTEGVMALPRILEGLRERGLETVTLRELLARDKSSATEIP